MLSFTRVRDSLCGRCISPLNLGHAPRNDLAYFLHAYFLAQTLIMSDIWRSLSFSLPSYLEIIGKDEEQ